jgi:hypothetical protein
MESLEDLEEFYQKEIENLDREFFDDYKKNKNKSDIVKNYREKLKSLKIDYEKKYGRLINIQKDQIKKNKAMKKVDKKPINNHFQVSSIDYLGIEKKENSRLKKEMFDFRLNLRIRNFYHKIPASFMIFYFRIKLSFKLFISLLIKKIIKIYEFFHNSISSIILGAKNLFIKIYGFFKQCLLKIPSIISKIKLKKKDKKEETIEKKDTSEKKEAE